MHEMIEFGCILDLEVLAVPFQPPARRFESEHTQQDDLRQRTGIVKIRDRARTSLAGGHPFFVVTG